jgi:hypothetical protein
VGADRHLTAAAKLDDNGALGFERRSGRRIIDTCDRGSDTVVVRPNLHGDDALPWRGYGCRNREHRGNARALLKPNETGGCENQRVVVPSVELAQARAEVAADWNEAGVWEQTGELRRPSHAARTDTWLVSEQRHEFFYRHPLRGRVRLQPDLPNASRQDHRVASILACQHSGDPKSLGKNHRHVLAAVDREIDFAFDQGILDFLDEETLAANLRQRCVRKLVAGGADDDGLGLETGRGVELRGDSTGLKQRELAAARADAKLHHRLEGSDAASSCRRKSLLIASV